jgi:hypothetical protein
VTNTRGLSASDVVTIAINAPPVVTISAPPSGARYNQGEAITFAASASDPEEGDLTPRLIWQSSLDGPIGSGGSFSRSDLSAGMHIITATVTDTHRLSGSNQVNTTINASVMDSDGLTGTHQIIITVTQSPPDTAPPTPDPMTWADALVAAGSSSISMAATIGSDRNGVEYYFACTAGGGHHSGWQDSPTYTDTGLQPQTAYTYRVKARDRSAQQNETGWSSPASATTGGGVAYLPFVSRAPGGRTQDPRIVFDLGMG